MLKIKIGGRAMLKKIVLFLLIIVIMSNTLILSADVTSKNNYKNSYTTSDNCKIVIPFSSEKANRYEIEAAEKYRRERYNENEKIQLYGPIIEDGTVNIVTSTPWTSGVLYEDGSKSSNILSSILNITLTISSYFTKTVYNIVKDVALIMFQTSWSEVVTTAPGSAKLSHSYSYIDKLGYVYNEPLKEWILKVDIQKRQWFRHEYASFKCTDGYTRSGTVDCIPTNGYSPIKEDMKYNYNNDSYIKAEASYRYKYNLGPYRDVFVPLY